MKKKNSRNCIFSVSICLTLFMLLFASCKQTQSNQRQETPESKTVKVSIKTKDSHVKTLPKDFELDRGTTLGFSELNDKMTDLTFETGYVIHKIFAQKIAGVEITDTARYTFNVDTTIFIVSKVIDLKDEVKLVSLEIDGTSKEIKNEIDAGKTKKAKVLVKASASPADAKIIYEPSLEEKGEQKFWVLSDGNNSLKLTVKKENEEKIYTVNIEKIDADAPILKKITVGTTVKVGNEITSSMEFTTSEQAKVSVEVETEPEGVRVKFNPELNDDELTLTGKETPLSITVEEGTKKTEYNIIVKKVVTPKVLMEKLYVFGGRMQGRDSEGKKEDIDKILDGEKDIVLELAGPMANLVPASEVKEWTSLEINGKKYTPYAYNKNKSMATVTLPLPQKEGTIDVNIKVKDGEDAADFSFKIKRIDQTVDVPVNRLFIRDTNVIDANEVVLALFAGTKVFKASEPTYVEVRSNMNAIKEVIIDEKSCNVQSKKDENDEDVWFASSFVTGVPDFPTPPNPPQFKDVVVTIEPIDEDTYHSVVWIFKLVQDRKKTLDFDLEVNNKKSYELGDFIDKLEKGENPNISVNGKFLNLKIICGNKAEYSKIESVKVNGDDAGTPFIMGTQSIVNYSVPLTTEESQIEIVIEPSKTAGLPKRTLKFKAKGDGVFEKLNPCLEEISGDKNFSNDFLQKIISGPKPLFKTASNTADILISLTSYEYEFLCKEVLINDVKTKIDETFEQVGGIHYWIKKSIPVDENAPKDVKIEFVGNKAENLKWEFQVQGGGEKPSLPKSMARLIINGKTNYKDHGGIPLPQDFIDHLTDKVTPPTFEFVGNNVLVKAGSIEEDVVAKVVFKMEGAEEEKEPIKDGTRYFASHTFTVSDMASHLVELIIYPKDAEKYSPLLYNFNIKSTGQKKPFPAYIKFSIDNTDQNSGYRATLNGESTVIAVGDTGNVLKEMVIGEKDSSGNVTNLATVQATKKYSWGTYREASFEVNLTSEEKHFVMKAIPNDSNEYEEGVCEYFLKGTTVAKDNAEFVFVGGATPRAVYENIDWIDGLQGITSDDYGAKAVLITAQTVSPRATVHYRVVSPLADKEIEGMPEKIMTNNGKGFHTAEKITLFTDKPTKVKVWVVAEDGVTIGEKHIGLWDRIYNPAGLFYGYEDKNSYADEAYDLIEFTNAQLQADKKIYLLFSARKEELGYVVLKDDVSQHQAPFVKLGTQNDLDVYKTSIDVSSLLGAGAPSHLEAILKIKKNEKECLTYKVKIKLKQ